MFPRDGGEWHIERETADDRIGKVTGSRRSVPGFPGPGKFTGEGQGG